MKKDNGVGARMIFVLGAALIFGYPLCPSHAYAGLENGELSPTSDSVRVEPATASSSPRMQIYMIDVGQGDSALVIFPDKRTMLIDAGDRWAGQSIINLLIRLGINTLDILVASHAHPDHTGGFYAVISGGYTTSSTKAYACEEGVWSKMKWRGVNPGDVIYSGGGATATCYAVNGHIIDGTYVEPERNKNARSIVLDIKFRGFDYLTGGDLTGSGGRPDVEDPLGDALVARGVYIDVYKVHHHGSRYSSNLCFLEEIMPEFAMISVGAGNGFGHPSKAVLNRLNDATVHVMRIFQTERGAGATAPNVTVADGQIVVSTDGASYSFANEGPKSAVFSYGPYPVDEYVGTWPMFGRN
ncbi:MAG: MBL fold metallo-hydrolase [Candidatus Aureabacteria bacterium]|nr:MBL fold metallo-hydrolase [Candidatus Auribacterota bacterium]